MDDKWFKQQQKKVGVTAEDIARRMGRSRSNVSHILNGHQRMSLDWAQAFADVLQVPLPTILEKAGVADGQTARRMQPGFADGDAVAWQPETAHQTADVKNIVTAFGCDRPGIDVWRVRSQAMALGGMVMGDLFLLDTHQSERVRQGDVVVAQIYNNNAGTAQTVLRRFEPPVLVAASADPSDGRVHVVDGVNVVIRGKVVVSWRN